MIRVYLFNKEYDEEDLADMGRDVMEMLQPEFNNSARYLPEEPRDGRNILSVVYVEDCDI